MSSIEYGIQFIELNLETGTGIDNGLPSPEQRNCTITDYNYI